MSSETHEVQSNTITSDAGGAFSGVIDHAGVDVVVDAFVELNDVNAALTATGLSAITITDARGKDVLNGAGAAPVTASTTHTFNAIGGTSASGQLTVAGTGAGNAKTFRVHLTLKR